MKKLLILSALFFCSYFSYAQNHAVGLSYDYIYGGGATRFANLDGGGSYHHQNGNKVSLNYSYRLGEALKLHSGVQFQQQWMQKENGSATGEIQTWDFKVETLNIPFYANLTFLQYLFIEGGPLLNIQINDRDQYGIDQQTGIGFALGIGAQYSLKKLNFFIKSQGQIQTLIPFEKDNYHGRVLSNSLSIGFFIEI